MAEVWVILRQVLGGVGVVCVTYLGFMQMFMLLFRGLPGWRLRWEEIPGGVKWLAGIAEAIFVAWLVGKGWGVL